MGKYHSLLCSHCESTSLTLTLIDCVFCMRIEHRNVECLSSNITGGKSVISAADSITPEGSVRTVSSFCAEAAATVGSWTLSLVKVFCLVVLN